MASTDLFKYRTQIIDISMKIGHSLKMAHQLFDTTQESLQRQGGKTET